jgi:polyhydroxyalkanoate synthesis regulator phasin
MKKKVMMVLGTVGALAIGLFAVAAVGAQEVDDVTRPVDRIVTKVAEKLGVSEDWNESAIELIDEAVANGDLDADRAEELKDRIAESDGIFVPRPHQRPHHDKAPGHMLIGQAANSVLDLEEGELREAFEEGQSLLDVALANGFTEDEFKTALLDEVQAQLDVMVDEEKIDQEKADEIYARISENIDEIINHTKDDRPTDRPHDGQRPHGPRPHGPRPFGSDVPETDAATTDL